MLKIYQKGKTQSKQFESSYSQHLLQESQRTAHFRTPLRSKHVIIEPSSPVQCNSAPKHPDTKLNDDELLHASSVYDTREGKKTPEKPYSMNFKSADVPVSQEE